MSQLDALDGTYTLDAAHSSLAFVARHAMVTKVRGRFTDVSGHGTTGTNLQGASVEVTLQVASVDTSSPDRDEHLKSADFFDAATYPTITFRSTEVTAVGDDTLQVTGDLTIKGVTKPVTIDFDYTGQAQDPFGNTRVGFEGTTVVNRKDFGLTWNAALEAGGVLVSEKITLEFDISAIKS